MSSLLVISALFTRVYGLKANWKRKQSSGRSAGNYCPDSNYSPECLYHISNSGDKSENDPYLIWIVFNIITDNGEAPIGMNSEDNNSWLERLVWYCLDIYSFHHVYDRVKRLTAAVSLYYACTEKNIRDDNFWLNVWRNKPVLKVRINHPLNHWRCCMHVGTLAWFMSYSTRIIYISPQPGVPYLCMGT